MGGVVRRGQRGARGRPVVARRAGPGRSPFNRGSSPVIALIVVAVIIVFFLVILANAVKSLRAYERGVLFRLGRLLRDPKGPSLFLLIPIVDRMVKVDLRVVTLV